MRIAPSVSAGTVLPSTPHVNDNIGDSPIPKAQPARVATNGSPSARRVLPAKATVAEHPEEELKNSLAHWVFEQRRGWPRYFELPGLAGMHATTADDVIHLFARVLHEWEDELHALAAQYAHKAPIQAAELAEVMAVAEQIVCAQGLATELDDIPVGGVSPRLLLAALSKSQAHTKKPRIVGGKTKPKKAGTHK